MNVTSGEDGQLVYELHQSDINTYLICPERARASWAGEVSDPPNDRTAVGTAVHAGIEELLRGGSADDALRMTHMAWVRETATPGFRYVKAKAEETCIRHIHRALAAWHRYVYPTLGNPLLVERSFDLRLDVGAVAGPGVPLQPIEIRLAGRIDHGDELGLYDWKVTTHDHKYTVGFGGDGWQLQRWGIQPSVYTWAVHQLGIYEPPVDFTYVALHPTTGKVTYLPCSRSEGDWAVLRKLCWNIVGQHLAGAAEWPLNNQHALCSADWCPNHPACMGAVCTPSSDTENHEEPAYDVLTSPGLV